MAAERQVPELKFQWEKEEIVRIAKTMYRSGMTNLFEGNVSMRVGETMLLTPSQQDKERLCPEQIIELDLQGNVLYAGAGLRPSVEYRMHAEVYRVRPDVRAIVHNHSAFATAYAVAGKPIASDGHVELNLLFGQVPVAPYGMLGTEAIYQGLEPLLRDYHVVLLENHGLLAVGPDLVTAYSRAEAAEKMAKTLLLANVLGGAKPLPAEELEQIRRDGQEKRHAEMRNPENTLKEH